MSHYLDSTAYRPWAYMSTHPPSILAMEQRLRQEATKPAQEKPAEPRRRAPAWSMWLVLGAAVVLIPTIFVAEVIRLRSYQQESEWVEKLAVWDGQQAVEADQKSKALARQAANAEDPEEVFQLDQEAADFARQSQGWRQQAEQTRRASAHRSFDWVPRPFSATRQASPRGS